jgi:hypothetical protein
VGIHRPLGGSNFLDAIISAAIMVMTAISELGDEAKVTSILLFAGLF